MSLCVPPLKQLLLNAHTFCGCTNPSATVEDAILIISYARSTAKNILRFVYFHMQRRTVINGNGGAHQ
jgi:hypothetical protein